MLLLDPDQRGVSVQARLWRRALKCQRATANPPDERAPAISATTSIKEARRDRPRRKAPLWRPC